MTSQDWLDEIADRPLTDLVEGLELVSSQSIPYAHLPRRLSIYSTELVRWSDVSAETPLTLMARPKIGESAVRALVQAAVEAVAVHRAVEARAGDPAAAVEALVARLDDYDRVVLATRVWPRSPNPRAAFVAAERLGVSDTSVRRNQARAAARFAELLGESVHQDVRDLAEDLHRRFGPYVPIDVVDAVLTDLGVDPVSQVAEVLLYVAGPYRVDGMWAEDISASGRQGVSAVVDELFASCPAPTVEAVRSTLIGVGMPAEVVEVYQREHLRLRRFGDVCVRWEGSNVADLIEAVLHGRGVGLTVEDLYEQLGADRVSTQRIAAVLSADERFVRASRRRWKLRSWGGGQYSSIADAISERIVAHGGRARVSEIVSEVLERFPDVTEKSVRSYLYSLAFVHDQGWVRRRKRSDLFPDAGPLNAVRGTFRSGLDEVRVVVAVDEELLRGSGVGLHPATANAVGVRPGQRKSFAGDHGGIVVVWKLSTTRGAAVSSLRSHAHAAAAVLGDLLVLSFHLDDGGGDRVEVTGIGSGVTGIDRLQMVLGHRVRSIDDVAEALECEPGEVEEVLRRRGDGALADDVVSARWGKQAR